MKGILITYLVIAALAVGTQVMAYLTHSLAHRKH